MTTGAAAETTPKERGERRSSRVATTLTALPDLLGDPIETEEQPRPGRRDADARAADLEEDRQTGGTAEPEEGGKAETGDNGSEKQPGAATKPKRRRRKTQPAIPVDLKAGEVGYKLSVTVPGEFDVALTRLLAGQRWESGHKVGKIEALRALVITAYNQMDWDQITWTTPQDVAEQMATQLGGE